MKNLRDHGRIRTAKWADGGAHDDGEPTHTTAGEPAHTTAGEATQSHLVDGRRR
jgi:hypothetical protein